MGIAININVEEDDGTYSSNLLEIEGDCHFSNFLDTLNEHHCSTEEADLLVEGGDISLSYTPVEGPNGCHWLLSHYMVGAPEPARDEQYAYLFSGGEWTLLN